MEDDGLDFNFWPSFADMMLSLVLVLVLIMFLFVAVKAIGTIDLRNVQKKQLDVVNSVARSYDKTPAEQPSEEKKETKEQIRVFCIPLTRPGSCEISVRNEAKLQRITFSDHILFKTNESELNPQGKEALSKVIAALKVDDRLSTIKEMQIQGHADNDLREDAPRMHNVQLAAQRAMAVYEYLTDPRMGVDPARHLMSATSFGEFNPVGRAKREGRYDKDKLKEDNDGDKKRLNRRIELLLFY